jgi:hypothetical protein
MNVAKRFYTKLKASELKECKLISYHHRICKQTGPVPITHLHEECKVEMLQLAPTIRLAALRESPKLTKRYGPSWRITNGYTRIIQKVSTLLYIRGTRRGRGVVVIAHV